MVRRLKRELPPRWDGTPRYPERVIEALEVNYTPEERQAHQDLKRYSELRAAGARDDGERYATEFVLKLLKKRLFSSPEAFRTTLDKHVESLANRRRAAQVSPSTGLLRRMIDGLDEEVEVESDAEWDTAADEAVTSAAALFRPLNDEEATLLENLRAYADRMSARGDSKLQALLAWLKQTLMPDGQWNQQRVILFTEYRATQKWLQERLVTAGFTGPGRVQLMYGGMPLEDREQVKNAFQASPAQSSANPSRRGSCCACAAPRTSSTPNWLGCMPNCRTRAASASSFPSLLRHSASTSTHLG